MVNQARASGALVTALYRAIEHGTGSIEAIPGLLKQVIREGAWRAYSLPHSDAVHKYDSFAQFAKDWLRAEVETLRRLCQKDTEALDLLDQVTTEAPGGDRQTIHYNIMNGTRQGTSNTYALRKLRKDRPDLHAKVLTGELSPNKAMIAAGFRPKQITIVVDPTRTASAIRKHFSAADRRTLGHLLLED